MTDPESTTTASDRRSDAGGWLLIGGIGVAALFLGFVHAPQRVKLPLVSALGLGALAGWGLGRWALARMVVSQRLVILASLILIVAGQIGAAIEAHRLGVKSIRVEQNRRNLEQSKLNLEQSPLADQIEQALVEEAEDEETRNRLRAEHEVARRRRREELDRQQRLMTFAGYLESRIPTQWGRWPPPWPELFWGAEIVLSSTLGAWIARRCVQIPASGGHQLPEAAASNPPDR